MFRKKVIISCATILYMAATAGTVAGAEYNGGLMLGYSGGPGFQFNGLVSDISPGFPMSLRLALGYTSVDPGNAAGARKIFINDATNGTPQQKGWYWDFRFDFIYQLRAEKFRNFSLYLGPRFAKYTANFNFIGGNENFDVTSNQWGLGFGMDGVFAMSSRANLVLTGGLDYYAEGKLSGHDTSYSPDGEDVNGRNDYTYADADEVINQPKWEPRIMIGVSYRFGH